MKGLFFRQRITKNAVLAYTFEGMWKICSNNNLKKKYFTCIVCYSRSFIQFQFGSGQEVLLIFQHNFECALTELYKSPQGIARTVVPKVWVGTHQWVRTKFLVGRETDKLVADLNGAACVCFQHIGGHALLHYEGQAKGNATPPEQFESNERRPQ